MSKKKELPKVEERKCIVCDCTESNCRQCIEKTGDACYWIDPDLDICSACFNEEDLRKGEQEQRRLSVFIDDCISSFQSHMATAKHKINTRFDHLHKAFKLLKKK